MSEHGAGFCGLKIQLLQLEENIFMIWQEKKRKYGFMSDSKFAAWLLNLIDNGNVNVRTVSVEASAASCSINTESKSNNLVDSANDMDTQNELELMIDESKPHHATKRKRGRPRKITLPSNFNVDMKSNKDMDEEKLCHPKDGENTEWKLESGDDDSCRHGSVELPGAEIADTSADCGVKIEDVLKEEVSVRNTSNYGLRSKPRSKVFGDDIKTYYTLSGRHPRLEDMERADDGHEVTAAQKPKSIDKAGAATKAKRIRCNICGYRHESEACDRHCYTCSKTFPVPNKYRLHLQCVHISEAERTRYKCPHCLDKGFRLRRFLNLHIKTCHSEQKQYPCDACDNHFLTERHLTLHKARFHGTGRILPCGMCKVVFTEEAALATHMRHIHQAPHFTCSVCGTALATRSALNRHMTNMHGGSDPHVCDACGKTFSCRFYLLGHMRRQHAAAGGVAPQRVLTCTACPRTFHTSVALASHFKAAHQRFVYQCACCDATYTSKHAWQVHVACEHDVAPRRSYPCPACRKEFKHSHRLRAHLATVHAEKTLRRCDTCCVTFRSASQLRRHKESDAHATVAAAVRRYQCGLCGQLFSGKCHVVTHLQQAHNVCSDAIEVKSASQQPQLQQPQLQQEQPQQQQEQPQPQQPQHLQLQLQIQPVAGQQQLVQPHHVQLQQQLQLQPQQPTHVPLEPRQQHVQLQPQQQAHVQLQQQFQLQPQQPTHVPLEPQQQHVQLQPQQQAHVQLQQQFQLQPQPQLQLQIQRQLQSEQLGDEQLACEQQQQQQVVIEEQEVEVCEEVEQEEQSVEVMASGAHVEVSAEVEIQDELQDGTVEYELVDNILTT